MLTNNLDERSKQDFLVYANSVIKSRAIPSIEDNLKPIHRKVLYTLWEDKVFSDKPTKKCVDDFQAYYSKRFLGLDPQTIIESQ